MKFAHDYLSLHNPQLQNYKKGNKGKGLKAVSAKVFGPDSCVCRSKPQADLPGEPVVKPLSVWPTDHKGVIVEMDLNGR